MQKFSLSIGIPMYNHERTIRATLDSIVCQLDEIKDICDLEVVISDNCSTDKSPEIIKNEYAAKYPDIIKYFRNERNIGGARNLMHCYKLGTKDYMWLCGDDRFIKGSIKDVAVDFLKYSDAKVILVGVIGPTNIHTENYLKLLEDGNNTYTNKPYFYKNFQDINNIEEQSRIGYSLGTLGCMCSLVVKTDIAVKYIDTIDYENNYPHADMMYKCAKDSEILIINKPTVIIQSDSAIGVYNYNRILMNSISFVETMQNNNVIFDNSHAGQYAVNNAYMYSGKINNYKEFISLLLKINILPKYRQKIIHLTSLFSFKLAFQVLTICPILMLKKFTRHIVKKITITQKPQIFMHTMGGLGNQLYQYAFARAYELRYGVRVNFISTYFWKKYIREVLPYRFVKNHQALGYHNGFQLDVLKTRKFNIAWNNVRYILNFLVRNIVKYEEGDCNHPLEILLQNDKSIQFFGYFANCESFNDFRSSLAIEITPKRISKGCNNWQDRIKKSNNPVSLHIRRGDYVINPIVRNSSICLSEDTNYYDLAIKRIKNAIGEDVSLFIFSDDLQWVRQNMKFDVKNIEYVEFDDQKKNSHEDMYLMSICNHNITANSTFSWWGGWLNKSKDKIVTTPFAWIKKNDNLVDIDKGLIYDDLTLIKYEQRI